MTPGYAVNVGALLGCVVLLALAAGTLLMRSGADRRRPAFLTAWARFCWCAATAAALYMLRGTAPDLLVIAVGNSALMLAWSLLWFGARLLRGARVAPAAVIALPVLWLAACAFPVFRTTLILREVSVFVMLTGLSAGTAIELLLLRETGQTRLCARALALMSTVYGAGIVWRMVSVLSMPAGSVVAVDGIAVLLTAVFINAVGFAGLAVASSLAAAREAASRAAAEQTAAMQAELDRTLARAPVVVYRGHVRPDGDFACTFLSRGIETLVGRPREQIAASACLDDILPTDCPPRRGDAMRALLQTGRSVIDHQIRRADGSRMWARTTLQVLDRCPDGGADIVGFIADSSVERDHEMRLVQAAKMEALGRLAGGMAHDFNNVLQAVQAGVTLGLRELEKRPGNLGGHLSRIADATERGLAVTGRLLAFARRGAVAAERIAPDALLTSIAGFLRPVMPSKITIRVEASADVPEVLADRSQLETVLVNLANNARDAMPAGGTLALTAGRASAEETPGAPSGLPGGLYVRLAVADEGEGMPPEVLARVCEPFFTTKREGEGTGLGLALAHGFAEQFRGGLAVASAVGQGTTVSIWLPVAEDADSGA
nr:ATP-binding protein [uncultured Rhodopila sp.]